MQKANDIEAIYKAYVDDLFSYAVYLGFGRSAAMDAVQEVFCKLCANDRLLTNVVNIKFYLLRSLKNTLLNYAKNKNQQTVAFGSSMAGMEDAWEQKIIDIEDQDLLQKKVEAMLEGLTTKQHEVIYLRYVLGLDYDKISKILRISPVSCRKLVHKSIQTLRKKN